MSEENTVTATETPATTVAKPRPTPGGAKKPVAPKAKPAAKAAPDKKAAKTESKGEFGMEKSKDVPWCDKKVTLFKMLKQLKAFSPLDARSNAEVVAKSGGTLTGRDVRHYSYHAKVSGLVGIAEAQEGSGYRFYLTAKGQKVDPVAELKAQSAK